MRPSSDEARDPEPGDPVPLAALAAAVAADLLGARPEVRHAALARLEEIYVTCEAGECVTDPVVAQAALPQARRALADADPDVRVAGASAVQLFAGHAGEAIPDLVRALVDPAVTVRLATLDALCEMGEGAAPAALQIAERLAQAPTVEERETAAVALGNIGARVDTVDDALLHDVPLVQASAAHALAMALEDEREERRALASQALHRRSPAR
jgi:HEAT repeat protein